jgi:hypothetical protein
MSTEDYKITDAPITAWFQGQKVQLIPVFGSEGIQHYDFCHICGAEPYGVEQCSPKLHALKIMHEKIFQLRRQHSALEKRAHTLGAYVEEEEEEKKIIQKEIEQLQLDIKTL